MFRTEIVRMGVKIAKFAPHREIGMAELAGKTLAVDAFNIMYQFLTTIRDRETGEPFSDSKGRVTSHLSGLFYRSINLMEQGASLIYVFDGKPPSFKEVTAAARSEVKKRAAVRLEKAVEAGEREAIQRWAAATSAVTPEMVDDAKRLLAAMGIPCVQAPSEAEAQAALMARKGDAWAVVSQDMDTLLFGAPRLVRNLSITGRRKLPGRAVWVKTSPELYELDRILKELGITRRQLVVMGLLTGTDYNPDGVKGIGPAKALKLVKKHKTLGRVMERVEWKSNITPESIHDFFMKPEVDEEYDVQQGEPDPEKIRMLLVDEHDFSAERVKSALKKLAEAKKTRAQKGLGEWAK